MLHEIYLLLKDKHFQISMPIKAHLTRKLLQLSRKEISSVLPIFVKMVTKMLDIINIKSPHAGFRTNDPDRNPFCDKSDDCLKEWTTLPEAKECIVLLLIQATHCIEHLPV